MLLFLAKKKPCSIILPLFTANQTTYHRFYSESAAPNPDSRLSNFILSDYLVSSCCFSPGKAARFSKRLPYIKSPEKPDAVLRFLNQQGFSNAEIHKLITWYPTLLTSCPETTLEPNLLALRGMGLSTSALNMIMLTSPGALHLPSAVPRIKFWFDFFGANETILVKAFKLNINLVGQDITKNIVPKISFLQSKGFSTCDIQRMIGQISRFVSSSIDWMEQLLERAKELGFHPESGMFVHWLNALAHITRENLQKKIDIFKSLGWLEEEVFCAMKKQPNIVLLSEENLRVKTDFWLGEAKVDHSYITARPTLLLLSLEKRLAPRLHILYFLKSKSLLSDGKELELYSAMTITKSMFVEKYILPHTDEIPELHDVYLATSPS